MARNFLYDDAITISLRASHRPFVSLFIYVHAYISSLYTVPDIPNVLSFFLPVIRIFSLAYSPRYRGVILRCYIGFNHVRGNQGIRVLDIWIAFAQEIINLDARET